VHLEPELDVETAEERTEEQKKVDYEVWESELCLCGPYLLTNIQSKHIRTSQQSFRAIRACCGLEVVLTLDG